MNQLSESAPEAIDSWCASMLSKPPDQASKMVPSITGLNYAVLRPATVENVENALYYAMTGQRRSSPSTRPTPGFSARSTSPSRRSSASLSSGFPKPPRAV